MANWLGLPIKFTETSQMAEVPDTKGADLVRWSRRTGQALQGLLVGLLVVMAVVELYSGIGAKTFLYQGF